MSGRLSEPLWWHLRELGAIIAKGAVKYLCVLLSETLQLAHGRHYLKVSWYDLGALLGLVAAKEEQGCGQSLRSSGLKVSFIVC